MPREIKTKISVDGEAAFKKSIKNINSELNVLSSELGAVTSGFDKGETSMKQLKAVGAVLEKQLEQQKIKVAALNGAVSDSKAAYDKACKAYDEAVKAHGEESKEAEKAAKAVEKAQSSMDSYTIQLNKAQKSLNETEKAFLANNKAAKEFSIDKSIYNFDSELEALSKDLEKVKSRFADSGVSMKSLKATGEILAQQLEEQQLKVKLLNRVVQENKEEYQAALVVYKSAVALHGEESEEAEKAKIALDNLKDSGSKYRKQLDSTNQALKETESAFKENQKAAKDLSNLKLSDLMPEKVAKNIEKAATAAGKLATNAGKAAVELGKAGANTVKGTFEASTKALTAYATAAVTAATAIANLTADSAQFADDINTLSKQTGLETAELQKMSYAAQLIDVDVDTVTKSMAKLTKNMTSSSKDTQAAFDTLGVSVRDNLTGELRDNQEVFGELITALGQVENETERDNLAMQIFGKSAQELNPLIEGGAEKLKELGDSAEEAGLVLSQEALDSLNAYNDSIDTLKANASAAGNVIAVEFAPKLQTVTDKLGKSLPSLATSFGKMFGGDTASSAAFRTQAQALTREIVAEINNMLPDILNGLNTVIATIGENVPETAATLLPTLIEGLKDLALQLVDIIPEILPVVTQAGADLFTGLIGGLNEVIEKLNPMLPEMVNDFGQTIIANAPMILETGVSLLANLINGIASALPELVEQAAELIPVLVDGLLGNLDMIIQAGINLIVALAQSLPIAIPALVEAVPQIIDALLDAFGSVDWATTSTMIFEGLGEGIVSLFSSALGIVDSLLGTNLQNWYNEVTAFWRDAGAKLYEVLNADKIKETEMLSNYGDLDDFIIQYSNELMRSGMSAAQALEEAKNKYLDSAEKAMYFEQNFANEVTAETAEQRRQILLETGQIYGTAEYNAVHAAEVEKAAAEEAAEAERAAAEESARAAKDAKNAKIAAIGESKNAALEALDKEEAEYEKNVKEQTSAAVSSYNSRVSAYENSLSSEKAALKKANSEKAEELKKQQKEETKLFEKAAKAELEELKKAHNEKLKLIDEEYTEKLKLVDEERYNQIKAIDDEIAAINGLTEAEEKAAKAAQQQEKLTELQDAVNSATTTEDRQAAEKELAEYKKELEREALLAEREARISELESKKDDINEEYDLKEENLKAEYELKEEQEKEQYEKENELLKERQEAEKTAFSERQTAELTALNERNEAALSGLDTTHKQRLADLEAEKEQEISNIKAVGEAQLSEYKKTMAAKRAIVEAENAAALFDINLGGASSLLGGAGAAFTLPDGFLKAVYAAESGAAMSAGSVTNSSTTNNSTTNKNITINNYSPTALNSYEQTQQNEKQLKAAELYG